MLPGKLGLRRCRLCAPSALWMLCRSAPTQDTGLYGAAWGVHCNRCKFLDTSVCKGGCPMQRWMWCLILLFVTGGVSGCSDSSSNYRDGNRNGYRDDYRDDYRDGYGYDEPRVRRRPQQGRSFSKQGATGRSSSKASRRSTTKASGRSKSKSSRPTRSKSSRRSKSSQSSGSKSRSSSRKRRR